MSVKLSEDWLCCYVELKADGQSLKVGISKVVFINYKQDTFPKCKVTNKTKTLSFSFSICGCNTNM